MFRVTRAEEQAVRLIMRMAHVDGQVTLGELAEAENLPEPTVAKLLGMLRRAGVVDALRGRYGGYVLARSADAISAASVIGAVSGDPVVGFPCGDDEAQPDCPRTGDCGLRPVWQHLEQRLTEVLEQTSVADLLRKEAVAHRELNRLWPLGGGVSMFAIDWDAAGAVKLEGRLDAASAPQAREFLAAVSGTCRLDFSRLEYIASVGLGILVAVQKRLLDAGGGLILAGLNPHLREVLNLAGFEGVFEFE